MASPSIIVKASTLLDMLNLDQNNPNAVKIAANILKNDGIICFATETVYALACDGASDLAVSKLYQLKKRDLKKPIAVFVKNLTMAKKFLHFNQEENNIANEFMPGMITLVLRKKSLAEQKIRVSTLLNDGSNHLALRIPDHKFCLELLNKYDGVIAATSANLSSQESAISFEQAEECFQNKVDLIIDGGICVNKIASTVLKVESAGIEILRSGLITKAQLEKFTELKKNEIFVSPDNLKICKN